MQPSLPRPPGSASALSDCPAPGEAAKRGIGGRFGPRRASDWAGDLMDKLTAVARSRNMSRIRSSDTKPELVVRRLVHRLGYRFRLHRRDLPGAPDLVFPARRKVIFVHGCYWHQHPGCREGRPPSSNQNYWLPKLRRTQERDELALRDLAATGWKALVLWECELSNDRVLERTIRKFLG